MRFSLWDAVTDGNMHWQETREGANGVDVSEGVFGVNLGSITPFPANLFATQPNLWLEVEADLNGDGFTADEIYSPRVLFTATPYAFHSGNADTVDGMDASAFIKGSASAYVVAETTDNAVTNGTNLIAAYATAKALTPHGQALGADNRAVVLVPPGKYDLGTGQLEMDTEFVDVAGLSTLRENQHIYGTSNGYGTGVLRQTADNVKIENLFVELGPTGLVLNDDFQDPAAYFPDKALANTMIQNCSFEADSVSGWSMSIENQYSGHYKDCSGGYFSFGGYGIANGMFENCTGGDGSFGTNGTASGTFTSCTGGNASFGYFGDASGTFTNCTGGYGSFGWNGDASGTFTNCIGGGNSFGYNGTASGTFTSCIGGGNSFGAFGDGLGGKYYFCSGGTDSFTTSGSPTVIHCIKDGVAYP